MTTVNKAKQLPRPAPVLDEEDERSDELVDLEQVQASGSSHRRLDSSSDEEGFQQAIQLNIATKEGIREALEF
jgi:hypothetical protein